MSEFKLSIEDISKEELLTMVDKAYASMMGLIGIDNLRMGMTLGEIPMLLHEKCQRKQSQWIEIENFKPNEHCYVHAYCNDIVSGWVELLHIYVCPEYGNYTIECLDGEDYPAIVTHVRVIDKPLPPTEQ